ncbi:glycosyltransferase family 2 protein [Rubrivirga sp. S365]|uniref:Glycosyltransferase family 2 protein n=1 Tax=Rubrivirga litoralis TaxID=3075598 RepID=A0ABU3BV58_9BACT|nr:MULTISPECIES: glycosyltransferase family 2 protein [unclassified Rubrivirga]MDT0633173.1 glycosyltransferase family 2 protein [Rubrivirga sp. F394]MDT7858012.1 glycosyltransferase family 2 protein [Rubrivirga sp. S365]
MDCSTIIVSYDTFDLTREAVRSALEAAPGLRHEVVVVDNDSPDGSAARLRAAFAGDARVRVVESGGNVGFAAANNVGAGRSSGRVLFFLNPDTVVHGDAVARLVAYLDGHPEAGAVGPRVLNGDGTDQVSTSPFDTAQSIARHLLALPAPRPPLDRPAPVDVVKGCALALRREVFDAVGGWDERYFMYAEENELCLALARAGRQNAFVPDAVVTHIGGAASAGRYAEQQVVASRSHAAFLRRHGSPALARFHRAGSAVGYGARAVAFRALARLRPARAADYRRRGDAAAAIWTWAVFDYS